MLVNFSSEFPVNNSVGISLDLDNISVYIGDAEGDLIIWTIEITFTNNEQLTNSSFPGDCNETKECPVYMVDPKCELASGTTYTWFVNASDRTQNPIDSGWTREWYVFTTEYIWYENDTFSFSGGNVSNWSLDMGFSFSGGNTMGWASGDTFSFSGGNSSGWSEERSFSFSGGNSSGWSEERSFSFSGGNVTSWVEDIGFSFSGMKTILSVSLVVMFLIGIRIRVSLSLVVMFLIGL